MLYTNYSTWFIVYIYLFVRFDLDHIANFYIFPKRWLEIDLFPIRLEKRKPRTKHTICNAFLVVLLLTNTAWFLYAEIPKYVPELEGGAS